MTGYIFLIIAVIVFVMFNFTAKSTSRETNWWSYRDNSRMQERDKEVAEAVDFYQGLKTLANLIGNDWSLESITFLGSKCEPGQDLFDGELVGLVKYRIVTANNRFPFMDSPVKAVETALQEAKLERKLSAVA